MINIVRVCLAIALTPELFDQGSSHRFRVGITGSDQARQLATCKLATIHRECRERKAHGHKQPRRIRTPAPVSRWPRVHRGAGDRADPRASSRCGRLDRSMRDSDPWPRMVGARCFRHHAIIMHLPRQGQREQTNSCQNRKILASQNPYKSLTPNQKHWSGKRGSNSRPQPWQGCISQDRHWAAAARSLYRFSMYLRGMSQEFFPLLW